MPLFELPLNHEHFDDLEGVFVVWHRGRNPVLCVGQGAIRTQLARIQQDPTAQAEHQEHGLYVTWASMEPEHRDGVESYLVERLAPAIGAPPSAPAIEVNLPQ